MKKLATLTKSNYTAEEVSKLILGAAKIVDSNHNGYVKYDIKPIKQVFTRKIIETEESLGGMFRAWYIHDTAAQRNMSDRPWLNIRLGKKREAIFADMLAKGETRRVIKGQGVFYFE